MGQLWKILLDHINLQLAGHEVLELLSSQFVHVFDVSSFGRILELDSLSSVLVNEIVHWLHSRLHSSERASVTASLLNAGVRVQLWSQAVSAAVFTCGSLTLIILLHP